MDISIGILALSLSVSVEDNVFSNSEDILLSISASVTGDSLMESSVAIVSDATEDALLYR